MTATAAPGGKVVVDKADDPRNPLTRLALLFDEGTTDLITAEDDSGMLAAIGRVEGATTVAFCSDATIQGGAMGEAGLQGHPGRLRARAGRGLPGGRAVALRWCPTP